MAEEVQRNDPCPCGSGKKYKHCHLDKAMPEEKRKKNAAFAIVIALGIAAFVAAWQIKGDLGTGLSVGLGVLVLGTMVVVFRDPPPPSDGDDPAALNFGRKR